MPCKFKIIFFLLLALFSNAMQAQKNSRPVVVYVTDALCATCYGMNAEMMQVQKQLQNKADFKVISSGFAANENAATLNNLLPYLMDDYTSVESKTGIRFGENFLGGLYRDDSTMLDSRNCAVALYIFSLYQPENALEFIDCLQQSIFVDGIYPDTETLFSLCAMQFDMEPAELLKRMQQDVHIKSAEAQFILSEDLGTSIIPSVFLQMDGEIQVISKGYASSSELYQRISKIISTRQPMQYDQDGEN